MLSMILFIVSFLSIPISASLSDPVAAAQASGNPWWIWILVFLAFFAFLILFLWWFVRSHGEEEEEPTPAPARRATIAEPAVTETIAADASVQEITAAEDDQETIALSESDTGAIEAAEAKPVEAEDVVDTTVEAPPEPAAIAEDAKPEPPAPAQPQQPDNLKRVEGIGPKISGLLQAAGITTFAQLAGTDPDTIRQILEEENPNLVRLADPTSWPAQARLAADGKWDELQQLQDTLRGGRDR